MHLSYVSNFFRSEVFVVLAEIVKALEIFNDVVLKRNNVSDLS